jgi:hypothetical protein
MAFSFAITRDCKVDGVSIAGIVGETVSVGAISGGVSEIIPIAATDLVVASACDITQLKAACLFATAALTVKTYLAAQLVDTIAVAANQVRIWTLADTLGLCMFTGDFDSLKVTNATGGLVTLELRLGTDPTIGG